MKTRLIFSIALTATLASTAEPSTAPKIPAGAVPSENKSTSVQDMLASGPAQLKMHSLSIILQGNLGQIDESYLPGLNACAQDNSPAIRSMAAKVLGIQYVQEKDTPNPAALDLLLALTEDPSADVRFNAIYYGLSQIKNKSPEDAELLIDFAAQEQKPALQDRIIVSLAGYQPQVEDILNKKLQGENAIAYFEIYEEFTGKEAPNAEKFLDMPSSRPRLFVVKAKKDKAEKAQSSLSKELKKGGIENPQIKISGNGDNFVLMVTTYITRDGQATKKLLEADDRYGIIQEMLLTPELEVQLDTMP